MAKVLIVAEHLEGKLNASTAKCVSAALALKPEAIDVVVLADAPAQVAAEAAQIAGVTRVLSVTNPANAHAIAQVLAPQVAKIAGGYTHVFGPSTTFGKDLMPCVAALLGVAQVSDVMSVEDAHTFNRPIYAGNAIVRWRHRPGKQWLPLCAPLLGRRLPRVAAQRLKKSRWKHHFRRTRVSKGLRQANQTALTCKARGAWSPVAAVSVRLRISK